MNTTEKTFRIADYRVVVRDECRVSVYRGRKHLAHYCISWPVFYSKLGIDQSEQSATEAVRAYEETVKAG